MWLELENTISQNLEFHDSELRSQRTHRGLLTSETVWCLNIILTGDWSLTRSDLSPNERCITWELTIFLPEVSLLLARGLQELVHVSHAEEHHLGGLGAHALHQDDGWDLDVVLVVLPQGRGEGSGAGEPCPANVSETDLPNGQN